MLVEQGADTLPVMYEVILGQLGQEILWPAFEAELGAARTT